MERSNHIVRLALQIQNHLEMQSQGDLHFHRMADNVLIEVRRLTQRLALTRYARGQGWMAAAQYCDQLLEATLQEVHGDSDVDLIVARPQPITPTLRDILGELKQLEDEFEECAFKLKERIISATTDNITLMDVELVRFCIVLYLDRLERHKDSNAFDIQALDPNPAAKDDTVTHPHVKGEKLCAGDAIKMISAALREGRICDAFLAINSILHTYNPGSPHAELESWNSGPCPDCGSPMKESYYCDNCQQSFCGDCSGTCDICAEPSCRNCLERDRESEARCCPTCRQSCGSCGRIVDNNNFDQATELCPGCLADQQQENQHEDDAENPADQSEQALAVSRAIVATVADLGTGPDVLAAGVAETENVPARRRCRNRRVRNQQRTQPAVR